MYIQITEKCNMSCPHCCYSCTEKGKDMPLAIFRKALEYEDEVIAIGGGEPTLHPNFLTILIEAIAHVEYIWLATNGSTKHIDLLYKLAMKNVISVALSLDCFHDQIDYKIEQQWRKAAKIKGNHGIEIRCVEESVSKQGRAIENNLYTSEECVCPEITVKPNGNIYQCGCDDSPKIGDVFDGFSPIDNCYDCYKNIELP